MQTFLRTSLALAAALLLSLTASAHEIVSGSIKITHPWVRETSAGATTGAGYLKIANQGKQPIKLTGGSSPYAAKVEVHSMTMDGGVMRMRPVEGGLEIPAGGVVALKPGGYHLMLIGLKKPLVAEDLVPLTLTFDGGAKVELEMYVEAMAKGEGGHEH